MKNMCFFAFLRPFLESTRSFGQLSSSSFQISGSNRRFPHSNWKSRIDGLMTNRPIDGPFRFIIFHPFPAFGCKSIISRSIERTISIADGFQSYQSWGTIGPKKTKIIILSFFHRTFPAIHRIYQLMTKRWLIDEKTEIYVIKKHVSGTKSSIETQCQALTNKIWRTPGVYMGEERVLIPRKLATKALKNVRHQFLLKKSRIEKKCFCFKI